LSQNATNISKLREISKDLLSDWNIKRQKIEDYAKLNNVPIRQQLEDGRVVEMVDIVNGKPEYITTFNYGAAQTTRAVELWEGGSSGLNISGEGYDKLGEWDAGHIRKSHQEFTDQGSSRVTNMDGESPTHYHSTHVAGTLIAAGINASAQGMAYRGSLKAWDWNGDGSEMAAAAADGLEISNHSYGQVRGWDWNNGNWEWNGYETIDPDEDYKFGFYDGTSRTYDQIAYNAPYYLIVKSAGNDRGEGPGNAGQNGNPEKDGGADGYDCIGGGGVAKNIMTVGAVRQVTEYTGPESVVMSSFSSWGPADDGRIKPDIVGKGVNVFSTMDGSDNDYTSMSGTSMASPNVAGSLALLQQYYQNTHDGQPMLSSTLKGLVIHTADEAGSNPGPDYKFGWGLMNTLKASELITEDIDNDIINEITLEAGDIYMKQIDVAAGADLKVTICWTDPEGLPLLFELNPRDPMLVNDLDLTLMDADYNNFYPYSLDPENPAAAATTTAKNSTDNVEMIHLSDAQAGTYTILVLADGQLQDNEQTFSLIITGTQQVNLLPECSQELLTPQDGSDENFLNQYISWQTAENATSYDVYFGTDGDGINRPTNIYNDENMDENGFVYLMDPASTYFLQIIPRNGLGPAEGCDQIWSFTTMDAISQYPYIQSVSGLSFPEYWQSTENSDASWHCTDLESHSADFSILCSQLDGLEETTFDNWFISPPFIVDSGKVYKVDFFYKNAVDGNSESIKLFWGETPFISDLTNLGYQGNTNDTEVWASGSGIIQPDFNGLLFLGFYTDNQQGYGLYIDDISIDYRDPSDVNEQKPEKGPSIYYSSGKLYFESAGLSQATELSVYNQMGQVVYRKELNVQSIVNLSTYTKSGIYIVRIKTGAQVLTKKILVQ